MKKVIIITGATDGIGKLAAKKLLSAGHQVILHGRNPEKLETAKQEFQTITSKPIESICADLSQFSEIKYLVDTIKNRYSQLDVIVNNAGIFESAQTIMSNKLDIRFMVNTIAPYLITTRLLTRLNQDSRVVNISSAAQAPVDLDALQGKTSIEDAYSTYAQSKLAQIMWTRALAEQYRQTGPCVISLNPGSLLGSKMVKTNFGLDGKDINIGADIIVQACIDESFKDASGLYFDNDIAEFNAPHEAAANDKQCEQICQSIDLLTKKLFNETF